MKRLLAALALSIMLVSPAPNVRAQWVVVDPTAFLQRLLHYVEQIQQMYEWYVYVEWMRNNLDSLDQQILRDLFPALFENVSWDHGQFLASQLIRLDPDSSDFYRDVLSLLKQAHDLSDGEQIVVDIDAMASLIKDAPRLREEALRYQQRYRYLYDARAYQADVNKRSQQRRDDLQYLANQAKGLGEESTMKALQILIASTALNGQSIEQIVQSHQQLLSQAQTDELRRLENEHRAIRWRLDQARWKAENMDLLPSSDYMDLMDDL